MSLNKKPKVDLVLEYDDGGSTVVFPAKIVPEAESFRRIQAADPDLDFALSLDEDAFSSLIIVFLEKYFDRALLDLYEDCDITEPPFYDYYGNNLYAYSDVRRMLEDIKETAEAIRNEQQTPIIDELIQKINPRIFHDARKDISNEEILIDYKEEIADYYNRFCAAVQSVMEKAPEYEYLDFCGP